MILISSKKVYSKEKFVAEEKAIEKVQDKSIVKTGKTYSTIIDYAKDLSTEVVVKSNCKLCNSIYRQEAEEMYIDGKSPHHVYKWLKGKNEDISANSVRNHFVQHYQKPISEQRIKAYAENLEDYSRIRMSEDAKLEQYSTLLDQQIHTLGSTLTGMGPDETRKTIETIVKLIDQAVKVLEKIKNMRQENEPIKILIERINSVMTVKYTEAQTPEVKKIIGEIVELIVKETETVNANK
jgi:hypothetical protein